MQNFTVEKIIVRDKNLDTLVKNLMQCHWGAKSARDHISPVEVYTQGTVNILWGLRGEHKKIDPLDWFNCISLGKSYFRGAAIHEWATLLKPNTFYREVICNVSDTFKVLAPLDVWEKNLKILDVENRERS